MSDFKEQTLMKKLMRYKTAQVSMVYILLILFLAIFAPVIANDQPIYLYDGQSWSMPAFSEIISIKKNKKHLSRTELLEIEKLPDAKVVYPIIRYSPYRGELSDRFSLPDAKHILGSDEVGRDVASRLIHGSRIAMMVGLIAVSISFTIALIAGGLAGYFGGWIDIIISRIIEIVVCLPTLLLILILVMILDDQDIKYIMLIIGLTSWTGMARIFRGQVLKIRNEDYISAAKVFGTGFFTIMFKHILPNAIGPVLVAISFGIASAILAESALSFLGMGDPTVSSWGELIMQGKENVARWHLVVFPGIAIFLTVSFFNLFGDAFRDAIDPRLNSR